MFQYINTFIKLYDYAALLLSSVLGLSRKTFFPGTVASLAAACCSFLAYYFLNETLYLFLLFIFLLLGYLAIHQAQRLKGEKDFPWIGIDEFAGMWLANLFLFEAGFSLSQALIFSAISFVIFRTIDITKIIPPLRAIDRDPRQSA